MNVLCEINGKRHKLSLEDIKQCLTSYRGVFVLYFSFRKCTVYSVRGNIINEITDVVQYITTQKETRGSYSLGNGDYVVWRFYVPGLTRCTDALRRVFYGSYSCK